MPAIGTVTLKGKSYKGELRTLSIRVAIEIVPNEDANTNRPDYRVMSDDIEVGAGWNRIGSVSGKPYVSFALAAPEFGPRRLYANLGKAAGRQDDDMFAIIWNPAD